MFGEDQITFERFVEGNGLANRLGGRFGQVDKSHGWEEEKQRNKGDEALKNPIAPGYR